MNASHEQEGKKPEDVTPEEQTEQAVPTEETEAEAPNPLLEELEASRRTSPTRRTNFSAWPLNTTTTAAAARRRRNPPGRTPRRTPPAAFLPVYDNLERALKQETADEAYKKAWR